MTSTLLPDFEHALALAGGRMDAAALSACHGLLCGLLCRRPEADSETFIALLESARMLEEPAAGLREALADLHRAARAQLEDEYLRLSLWLPVDEQPLSERTLALSRWCSGFLAGVGGSGDGELQVLSADAREALADLAEIAGAEIEAGGDTEEEENAFAEIVEYVRVATLMLSEDLRGPGPGARIH